MSVDTDAPLSVVHSPRFFLNRDVNFEDTKWESLMRLFVDMVEISLRKMEPPFSISIELKQKRWDHWWVAKVEESDDGEELE